jgi:hypothetical protein
LQLLEVIMNCRNVIPVFVVQAFLVLYVGAAMAQEPAPSPELLARIAKEKEDRKACKADICKGFAQPSEGKPIACAVTKTWLSQEIQAGFLRDKLTWPWGDAQCSADIELDRNALKEAASQPKAVIKLKKHNISCKLGSKDPKEGTAYDLKLAIEPTVSFEGGKAVKVEMGWGSIEAPMLAKSAIWSATAVDANFSVISNNIVTAINNFLFEKCKEVGVEITSR